MALDLDHDEFENLRSGKRPHLALLQCIRSSISEGELRAGDRLPTQRELARRLGLAIGTVTKAYSKAAKEGLISTEIGRGTFVLESSESRSGTAPYDLTFNHLAYEDAHPAELGRQLTDKLKRIEQRGLFDYYSSTPDARHNVEAARWLSTLGHDADPGRVLICNSVQHGLSLVLQALARPGATVLTEELGFPGIGLLGSVLGFRLRGVRIDDTGLKMDSLRALCTETEARLLVCAPTLHNPTNGILSLERRQELAKLAKEFDLMVIEYDVNGIPVDEPLPSLTMLAPERTIFITSTWKATGMGAALGYLVCPQHLVQHLAAVIQATTWSPSPLLREVVTGWLADGTAAKIIAWHKSEIRARLDMTKSALVSFDWRGHPSSYTVWLLLPEFWRREVFCDELAKRGVIVSPADQFVVGRSIAPHAIRFNLGAIPDRGRLAEALEIMTEVLTRGPQPRVVAG